MENDGRKRRGYFNTQRGILKLWLVLRFSFMSSINASSLWTIHTPISRHHRQVSGRRLYRTLAKPWSQHLQTVNRLTLQFCYLYIGLSRNSSLFYFLFFVVFTNIDGPGVVLMKSKSVLFLNKINTIFIFTYVVTEKIKWAFHPRFVTMGDAVFFSPCSGGCCRILHNN